MNEPVRRSPLPAGFPNELASAAYVAPNNEVAWRPSQTIQAVEWFGIHGYAVLGTKVFLPKQGSLQSLPYFSMLKELGLRNGAYSSLEQRRRRWRMSTPGSPCSGKKAMYMSTSLGAARKNLGISRFKRWLSPRSAITQTPDKR